MRQCATAKEEATARLGPPTAANPGVEDAPRDPMNVVEDGDAGVRKGAGGDGQARGDAGGGGGANGGGLVGKAGMGKGKLRAILPPGVESGVGR